MSVDKFSSVTVPALFYLRPSLVSYLLYPYSRSISTLPPSMTVVTPLSLVRNCIHATVEADQVNYYVDGQLISTHSDKVAPEQPMSINFNLWFMPKGADGSIGPVDSDEMREYRQDIDWVFHIKGALLSTVEVKDYVT
ncbi:MULTISPECIES: hypothetical protein [Shewanella]|uniref:hypothetical protein n=1 Tax=Shewanella TaxID=22 RepID=UPI00163D5692|nr:MULTISPECIES: hypothetical protein [Shewanella]